VFNCPLECETGDNETGKCDLKIFVTWLGTDKNGLSLTSSSERLLNFEKYNLKDMY